MLGNLTAIETMPDWEDVTSMDPHRGSPMCGDAVMRVSPMGLITAVKTLLAATGHAPSRDVLLAQGLIDRIERSALLCCVAGCTADPK